VNMDPVAKGEEECGVNRSRTLVVRLVLVKRMFCLRIVRIDPVVVVQVQDTTATYILCHEAVWIP
jgi:hypothetical protein